MLPHPPIPLGIVRTTDIVLLLIFGAISELLIRLWILLALKRKPDSLRILEANAVAMEREAQHLRAMGPSEFVATSKIERKLLQVEQDIEAAYRDRKEALAWGTKFCRNINWFVSIAIFVVFYGIPLISLDGIKALEIRNDSDEIFSEPSESHKAATDFCRSLLFPLSFIGIGMRVSRWGLLHPESSIGALVIFWSAQTTVSKIMDGVDALVMLNAA